MAGVPHLLRDVIVLKLVNSGEAFMQARLLSPDRGVVVVLRRRSRKQPSFAVDLFDQGEATVDLKPDGSSGFLTHFTCERKRLGIGRSYAALEAASWLSNFLLANPVHEENQSSIYQLAVKAYDALDRNLPSHAVLLKTLYVYSRDEGYPILADWARHLPAELADIVTTVLNTPLAELQSDPHQQQAAFDSLVQYIKRHTQIYLGSR